mmetsp:Transcript_40432/g.72323  ORF Transcript_40432/g.72323 Transcript_40432/m.72323 type:complete len:219 (-) Transcript_40432:120-776(-)
MWMVDHMDDRACDLRVRGLKVHGGGREVDLLCRDPSRAGRGLPKQAGHGQREHRRQERQGGGDDLQDPRDAVVLGLAALGVLVADHPDAPGGQDHHQGDQRHRQEQVPHLQPPVLLADPLHQDVDASQGCGEGEDDAENGQCLGHLVPGFTYRRCNVVALHPRRDVVDACLPQPFTEVAPVRPPHNGGGGEAQRKDGEPEDDGQDRRVLEGLVRRLRV